MLKSRHNVYSYIMESTRSMLIRPDERLENFTQFIYDTHKIPKYIISDILTQRIEEVEATTDKNLFYLYAIIEAIYEAKIGKYSVDHIFTDIEKQMYQDLQYVEQKIQFPLRFSMIQIEDDQWVGRISASSLMMLTENGLIKYNPSTQRALRKRIMGENVEFRIDINKSAIKGIRSMYHDQTYISNDIVLNMGDTSEADFEYDEKTKELVINSIKNFDMIDGYNRFYAMSQEKVAHPDFDVNFVLQIMSFSEDKAQQYIYQQDLKIKMQQLDVANMNKNAPENKIVSRLNDPYSGSEFKGKIGRNGAEISGPELAASIKTVYLKDIKKRDIDQNKIVSISKEIIGKTNMITSVHPDMVSQLKTANRILTYAYLIHTRLNSDTKEVDQIADKIYKSVINADKISIRNRELSPKVAKQIQSLYESA